MVLITTNSEEKIQITSCSCYIFKAESNLWTILIILIYRQY